MGKIFTQISLEERERLFALKAQHYSFRNIAKMLGRDHTTWSREWKKNRHPHTDEYIPCKAHTKAEKRKKEQRTKAPLKCPEVYLYVREHLRINWSPETIAGRISIDIPTVHICSETIYNYIYEKAVREKLWEYLTRAHRKRRHYGNRKYRASKIADRVFIEKRPTEINTRETFGHWEVDLMEGNRETRDVVQVFQERKSRKVILKKLKTKKADEFVQSTLIVFNKEPLMLTTTSDNGPENSKFKDIGIPWYFCRPYHSWEKGGVENQIGRTRSIYPKGKSLQGVTQKQLDESAEHMNNTPRKCLDYKTPNEVYKEEILKLKSKQA